jgi:hypothetical protein
MDVSTTSFSPTQAILACILIVLLLSWFFIFTTMAIRDYVMKKVDWEDMPTPTSPIQAVDVRYKPKHYNFVELAANAKQHERADSERSSDSGTTLFK